MTKSDVDDWGGHYLTSGAAVLGLGVVGLVAATGAALAQLPLGFIDRPSMVVASLGFVTIGAWMRHTGRKALGAP